MKHVINPRQQSLYVSIFCLVQRGTRTHEHCQPLGLPWQTGLLCPMVFSTERVSTGLTPLYRTLYRTPLYRTPLCRHFEKLRVRIKVRKRESVREEEKRESENIKPVVCRLPLGHGQLLAIKSSGSESLNNSNNLVIQTGLWRIFYTTLLVNSL